jgi:HD-GYP domain-containing protein (c-di-GMP phosphodiesterase class II)
VDVWDALLSDRPYRPAWDKQAVLNYLEEQSGKLFDPKIVNVFLQVASDETTSH